MLSLSFKRVVEKRKTKKEEENEEGTQRVRIFFCSFVIAPSLLFLFGCETLLSIFLNNRKNRRGKTLRSEQLQSVSRSHCVVVSSCVLLCVFCFSERNFRVPRANMRSFSKMSTYSDAWLRAFARMLTRNRMIKETQLGMSVC